MKLRELSRERALEVASKIIEELEPFCYPDKCKVAGSIRRMKPVVGDIEIICKPKFTEQLNLFGEIVGRHYPLYDQIKKVFSGRHFVQDGTRKKMILLDGGIYLDLFIILEPAQWGYRYAITTGPAEWNKYLVTPRAMGGAFPRGYRSMDGAIYSDNSHLLPTEKDLIPMPTEKEYFDFLGLPLFPPEDRKPPERWIPF